MKKSYRVFVAGATTLDYERMIIRSAIDLWNTTELLTNPRAVQFRVFTYENFDDVITDPNPGNKPYNLFIKNKADLALFILSGQIGKKTKEEFFIAYDSLLSNRKAPGIIVFSKEGEKDAAIEEIKQFVQKREQYYIVYHDNKELQTLVEPTLRKYLAGRPNLRILFLKRFGRIILAAALLLGLAFGGFVFFGDRKSRASETARHALELYRANPTPQTYNTLKKEYQLLLKYRVPETDTTRISVERALKIKI